MREKWMRWGRWIILYGCSVPACELAIAGCYPLIPVYFAVMYLQQTMRSVLTGIVFLELLLLLPLTDGVKYATILICIMGGIWIAEWLTKSCKSFVAAILTGLATGIVGCGGQSLLYLQPQDYLLPVLEGIFAFSATMSCIQIPVLLSAEQRRPLEVPTELDLHQQKLQEYAQSFQSLAKVFTQMNQPKQDFSREEIRQMEMEITGKVCISCNQCAICWEQKERSTMDDIFLALLHSIKRTGEAKRGLLLQLEQSCTRPEEVVETMMQVFEKARLNFAWYNRLVENREAIAQQLDAMVYIMEDCLDTRQRSFCKDGRRLGRVRFVLRQHGIRVEDVILYEDKKGRWQVRLKGSTKAGNFYAAKEIAKILSKELKRKMVPHRDTKTLMGQESGVYLFEEDARYQELHGVARLTKEGAAISGDNFSVLHLESREMVLSLSDGMGFGASACKESEMVVELMERFLEAGFSRETAIRMMNSTMVLHGDNDLFSTVDVAAVNLYDGSCSFYKVGAAATFIRHGGTYEYIQSRQLPTGVTCQLELEPEYRQLTDGDWIIMMTDGVLEHLNVDAPEETMVKLLSSIDSQNPTQFAKKLLERVLFYTQGRIPDDMTVLCAGIWEKD